MKRKKFEEIKTKKPDELRKLVEDKKLELLKTQAIIRAGQEKNLKKAKNLKIEIAQLLTVVRNMELSTSEEPRKEEK